MNNKTKQTYVIGHKNPDTDSICSAIAYAHLKKEITGERYSARRAGQINEETQYVLKRFQMRAPKLLPDVKLQLQDAEINKIEGCGPNVSIKRAWELLKKQKMKTLPILENDELLGIITAGDIASSYMDIYDNTILAGAKTQYSNIIDTLDGTLITGDPEKYFTKGKVSIGASSPDLMTEFIAPDDLVILGNRYESHSCAIDINVNCIIVCQNAVVSEVLVRRAESQGIVIIQTPYDTFNVARLINQSIPVKHFMTPKDQLCKFYIDDHNERSQAVDGLEEAEIMEIIDHHRLGNIETAGPVYFRNQPVGCTATIVYQMYQEHGVEITPQYAGILCSAIISDTLMFRSPTCTAIDISTAEHLAQIADVNMEELSAAMFKAGSNLEGKTPKELFYRDFKQFRVGDMQFGVGQINSMDAEEIKKMKEMLKDYLQKALRDNRVDMIFFMLTNIMTESSEILCCGQNAKQIVIEAFDLPEDSEEIILKKVVSRKKQVVPLLMSTLQH